METGTEKKPTFLHCIALLLLLVPGFGAAQDTAFWDDLEDDAHGEADPTAQIGFWGDSGGSQNGTVVDTAIVGIPAPPGGGTKVLQVTKEGAGNTWARTAVPLGGTGAKMFVHAEWDYYTVDNGFDYFVYGLLANTNHLTCGRNDCGWVSNLGDRGPDAGAPNLQNLYADPGGVWVDQGTSIPKPARGVWHHFEIDYIIGDDSSMFFTVDNGTPVNLPGPWGWDALGNTDHPDSRGPVDAIWGAVWYNNAGGAVQYVDNLLITYEDTVTPVSRAGPQQVTTLSFQSENGRTYRVEKTSDLLGGTWTAADWKLCGNGSARHVVVPAAPGAAGPMCYRLQAGEPCEPPVSRSVFVDLTAQIAPGLGGGKVFWGDYDNDGFVDFSAGGFVHRNLAGQGFTIAHNAQGLWGDWTNDGFLDLFGYPGGLGVNLGGNGFSGQQLPGHPQISMGATWVDVDGDSYLDVYVGGYEIWTSQSEFADVIYANQGGASMVLDWTQPTIRRARGVTACDFDEDGDQDIYVSTYRLQPNILWRNDGSGGLTDVADTFGALGGNGHTIGSAWGDLDNDGHFDLFVGNFSHPDQPAAQFLRNMGPGESWHFDLMDTLSGTDWQESYASPALGDFDNDGLLDLFFTTVYAPKDAPRLYRNLGNWQFENVTEEVGLPRLGSTYQAGWADFDNDGDLDLITAGRLFVNLTTGRHWLKVKMLGTPPAVNRSAIGAQVRIQVGADVLTRQVEGGTGEGNQNDLTLHFGLGFHSDPVNLEVFWPNGATQVIPDVAVDQTVTVEGPL